MSTLFIVFLSISSLCFVGGVLGYGGIPCLLIGSFSCAYLLACLHELAHALACKLTGAKVVKIALLFFKIENGKLFLLRKVSPFKVSFVSGKNNAIVYLAGIFCSLFFFAFFLCLYLILGVSTLLSPLCAAALLLLCNLIGKHSDLANAVRNLRHGE